MITMDAAEITDHLLTLGSPQVASHSQKFFKTAPGEYGAGDKFIGIRVPVIRARLKALSPLPLDTIAKLICSEFHELRLFAALALVECFQRADERGREEIYHLYQAHHAYINNWDIVDCSAHKIVGPYLVNHSREPLYQLADSDTLWQRRIAVIVCFHFIKQGDFDDILKLSQRLFTDPEELIHKAVGWMLREVGKRDRARLESFLNKHYKQMPRTMLRYAIEKFPAELRQHYLKM
ncbi:DNA alkylation repair protein [uncultured Shewanella sp.]|uniref:DNA alkylation repair protein n=1 Tax=uncultured Shewanella sp. TaxID=173975 RepID=UPI00261AD257|nr:DNA alkylation repair protein [uncultured Shewanella sp.]